MYLKKLVTAMIIGSFMLATVPTNLVLAENETVVVETTKEEIVPISQEENQSEETANKEETKPDNQTLENTEEKSENEKEVQLEDKKVEKENKTEHKKIENKKENKVEEKKKNNNQNNNKKKDTVNSKKNGKNTKYAFTLDSVNMRSQANTKSKVLVTLKKNTKLTILKKENGWLKVQYGKKVGYVLDKYVKVISTSNSKPVENKKPVTNNNSNSANKKPTSNTVKGMSFGEFQKQLPKLGYKEYVVNQYGGTYLYYVGQRYVGFCDYRHTKKDNDTIRISFIIEPDTINESYLSNWNTVLKNSFNLLIPTQGDRLYKMIVTKEKEDKLSELNGKTFDMDGRKVQIELSDVGHIYVNFFEK